MSLLKPTPGQVIDRLTILELKIEAYRAAKRPVNALLDEGSQLRRHISKFKAHTTALLEMVRGLEIVNRELWAAEDKVRALPPEDLTNLAHTAREIARLNDARMFLVHELDKAFDWKEPVEEKVYTNQG